MKKILVVEDDDFFRSAVKSILSKNYEVFEANNGKTAKDLINLSSFDLIISDIQMPYFTGVDLLAWVKSTKPTFVILMTGFSQILETQKAHELGADDFLAKPFKETELLEKVKKLFGETAEEPQKTVVKDLDNEFCRIPIEDFITERHAEYAVFVRMPSLKYIKIAHNGAQLTLEKMTSLKEKGVTHLYIQKEDFHKLVGFTLTVSKAVLASQAVDKAKKSRFMKYTGEMIMQQAFVQGTDEALFRNAKDYLTSSMEVLTENQETFTLLELLSTHTDYLYTHSVGVSLFSVMIAKQLGWQSTQTLFKTSFAGLFHDIGKKEISRELLEKPRALLSQQERQEIETHATRGKEILESLRGVPSEVIQAAYEHHEDVLGQGYPQRLNNNRIHPISLIVSVADTFCNYTIRNPQRPEPLTAAEAISAMTMYKATSLDAQSFEALKKIVRSQRAAS